MTSADAAAADATWTRRRLLGALAGVAVAAPFLGGRRGAAAGDGITLRYTSHIPRSHGLYGDAFVPFSRMVEEVTGGRLRLEPFMDGLLHGPNDGFKAAHAGITDYTHGYATYQPGSFRITHALQLPFLFSRPSVASLVAEELYPRYFKDEYERMGVYLAHIDVTSPYDIISREPIRHLEDLRGRKVRATGGVTAEILLELGAIPVVMAAAEVYPAFQRRVVDAVALGVPDIAAYRLYEIGKHLTIVHINVTALQYCLNPRSFDALPDDLREAFYRLLRVRSQIASQDYYGDLRVERALAQMSAEGVEVLELEPDELDRWRRAVVPVEERFVERNEADGLPARAVVSELRRLAAETDALSDEEIMASVRRSPVPGLIDL